MRIPMNCWQKGRMKISSKLKRSILFEYSLTAVHNVDKDLQAFEHAIEAVLDICDRKMDASIALGQ